MKRQYLIPVTILESFNTGNLCQTPVVSVQGGTLGWGGEGQNIVPN